MNLTSKANLASKIASLAAMGLSSLIAPKIASASWKAITGNEPPSEEEGGKFIQIIAFAALSAVFVSAIQFVAMRGADKILPAETEHFVDDKSKSADKHSA